MNKQDKEKAEELYPTDFNYLSSGVINVPVKEREAFVKGAEWKEQRVIEKAVEYLIFNTHDYYDGDSEFAVCNWLKRDEFIENFKQAMKE